MRKLTGGKTIAVDPARLQFPIYGDSPKVQVGSPGTVTGNVATGVQVLECAKSKLGQPDLTWVKVVFREIEGEQFLVIAPVKAPADPTNREPDTYPLKFHSQAKAPIVRGLKLLFESNRVELRKDTWYEMTTEVAEDETLGMVVCGNWTKASTRARTVGDSEAAAAKQ